MGMPCVEEQYHYEEIARIRRDYDELLLNVGLRLKVAMGGVDCDLGMVQSAIDMIREFQEWQKDEQAKAAKERAVENWS
jgi:hypothetical protein